MGQKYDTIISLRCPYFAKDPKKFLQRCYTHLHDGGRLYIDWGLGDHWRFEDYKIGWVKNGQQEHAYSKDNFLWSTVWDDSFIDHEQFKLFASRVKSKGYSDVKRAIDEEVPQVMLITDVEDLFHVSYEMLALWQDMPQLYIFMECLRK